MGIHPDDRMSTRYEWKIEFCTADEHEDIEDMTFADRLKDLEDEVVFDALRNKRYNDDSFGPMFSRLCLARDRGCNAEGIMDRQHAYVDDEGNLPETFDEGATIPARFRKELAEAVKAMNDR